MITVLLIGTAYILIGIIVGMSRAYYLDAVFERDEITIKPDQRPERTKKWTDTDEGPTIAIGIFWPILAVGYIPYKILVFSFLKFQSGLQKSIKYAVKELVIPRRNV